VEDKSIVIHARDYNTMAANLANRGTLAGKPVSAYENSLIGRIAG
jgi:hypothetical protein